MNFFGPKLRALRKKRHLTQDALAQMLNIDKSYICALECGKKQVPANNRFVARLADKLNLTMAEVADLTDSASLSARKTNIPPSASEAEVRLIRKLLASVGHLQMAQIAAMENVLNIE